MSTPQVAFTNKKDNPGLKDLLDLAKKDIFLNFNCHAIGVVKSFNSALQTIQATILYKKSVLQANEMGVISTVFVDYPVLIDVPVIIMRGGAFSLTFPISVGDEVLILFNDRDIDNWFQSGANTPVASGRLHAFADGLALIGPRSKPNALGTYDMTHALLSNGSTQVGVSATQVRIANSLYTLNGLLQQLVTQIEALVTATAAITVTNVQSGSSTSGPPSNASTITSIGTQLSTIATHIGALLE